jgi:glucose-1-phosphate thymidylyltransferase
MKAIILAGGTGSRLYPMSQYLSKQLQTVYDKPMIYYPLSILMLTGIKDILVITTQNDQHLFKKLLSDGSHLGINIQYEIQAHANGIPEAFIIGEKFIGKDPVAMVLGDNLFYGGLSFFREAVKKQKENVDNIKARIFAYWVSDPSSYGVVEFDRDTMKVKSIEEKPAHPKSNYAIPGIYVFDSSVSERAKKLKPGKRGETEIVDLMNSYLSEKNLGIEVIGRGVAWLDTGTPQSLLEASNFIGVIEQRQGLKVACLEEIALRMNYISKEDFQVTLSKMPKSNYQKYLEKILLEIRH